MKRFAGVAVVAAAVIGPGCATAPPSTVLQSSDPHRSPTIEVEGAPIQLHAERDTVSAETFLVAAVDDSVAPGRSLSLKANFVPTVGLASEGGRGLIRYPIPFVDRKDLTRFPGAVSVRLETISAQLQGTIPSHNWKAIDAFLGEEWDATPRGGLQQQPVIAASGSSGPSGETFAGVLGILAGILGVVGTSSEISDAEEFADVFGVSDPDLGALETQRIAWALVGASGFVLMIVGLN